jgi:site-specific recombinase XerD
MAAVDFKIYKVPAGKKATIFAVLRVSQSIRPELATGERVYPQHWGAGRVKGGPDKVEINLHLNQIEKELLQVWRENPTADKSTFTELAKKVIRGEFVQKKTVETWMRDFVSQSKKKAGTAQVYNATIDHLEGYTKSKKITITWESFDLDFYESFVDYLYGIGHNDNTVGKYIRKLKHLISEAFERNLHTNLSFKKKGFKAPSAEVDEIYLSEAEIIQFYNVDLPDLLESKMRFVFACWVGLRFGDLTRINPNQVLQGMNGPVLKVVTEKTGEEVIIPLHPLAQEIWNYWQKNPPRKIDNPTFNEHIKTIAEKAGFEEPVQKRNTIKGKVSVQWVKKFEMVKAHTARRSFATNCYLMGMPSKTIMAVTGHRTEKAFLKYIRVTKDQHANIMADFFNRNSDTPIMRKAN